MAKECAVRQCTCAACQAGGHPEKEDHRYLNLILSRLKVTATHFEKTYQTGQRVSKAEFNAIRLTRHAVCPQWNYTIHPRILQTAE